MSKYESFWTYIAQCGEPTLTLSFCQLETLLGFPVDHSLLSFKKELLDYGYRIEKISLKQQKIRFIRVHPDT